jgi:hypothetical protein
LFENGQEYQYSYQAYTLTGVREPTWFGSSFGLRGNLIIQKQAGEALLKVQKLIRLIFLSFCIHFTLLLINISFSFRM